MAQTQPEFDASRKFVRVTGERNGIVEFEFGIGDLSLAVELMLPPAAFEDFCAVNKVTVVQAAEESKAALDDAQRAMGWRPSDVQSKF